MYSQEELNKTRKEFSKKSTKEVVKFFKIKKRPAEGKKVKNV